MPTPHDPPTPRLAIHALSSARAQLVDVETTLLAAGLPDVCEHVQAALAAIDVDLALAFGHDRPEVLARQSRIFPRLGLTPAELR